ncbi:tRNA (guanosine(46)-N7)-methyltransferase TrmB [Hominifimenecus sp. rT4P-3]|uniref:tRNA (guanosine(46)-N7)-methyltransferase TrmB n=1 Tax=Hominifimenecus sp. rT4P-3 TaxID=3242979 RepID=UPI003DA51B8D
MRLKNVPGAREAIADSKFVVLYPEQQKGNWAALFGNDHPVHIEIGMGKGKFLTGMAAAHPDINYIGIEKYSSVLLRAVQKQEELRLPNLRLIRMDAEALPEVFDRNEVARIYLNFSDPWPKDRHAKRRLTSGAFLARYHEVLTRIGRLEFKTDNRSLFEFSLESIVENGWRILENTSDLHHSELNDGNIMTEYEERFSALGNPIYKLIADQGAE